MGDFNGDGKPDIFIDTITGYYILLGNGDGTFQSAVENDAGFLPGYLLRTARVGDFNNDGKLDLVVSGANAASTAGSIRVFLGNGDGTLQAGTTYDAPGGANPIASGDFNGDGKVDLVVGTTTSTAGLANVYLGNGDGTFQAAATIGSNTTSNPIRIAVADLNGDGKLDFVFTRINAGAIVMRGVGDGTFGSQAILNSGTTTLAIAVGDTNGDGKPDLIMSGGANSVEILLGNGDATFQAPVLYYTGTNLAGLVIGDFNGDSRVDLVVANQGKLTGDAAYTIAVLLGVSQAAGSLQPSLVLRSSKNPSTLSDTGNSPSMSRPPARAAP